MMHVSSQAQQGVCADNKILHGVSTKLKPQSDYVIYYSCNYYCM